MTYVMNTDEFQKCLLDNYVNYEYISLVNDVIQEPFNGLSWNVVVIWDSHDLSRFGLSFKKLEDSYSVLLNAHTQGYYERRNVGTV